MRNVMQIKSAEWNDNLGNNSDQFGLRLYLEGGTHVATLEFDTNSGRLVMEQSGVTYLNQLVGRSLTVDIDGDRVSYIGPAEKPVWSQHVYT